MATVIWQKKVTRSLFNHSAEIAHLTHCLQISDQFSCSYCVFVVFLLVALAQQDDLINVWGGYAVPFLYF